MLFLTHEQFGIMAVAVSIGIPAIGFILRSIFGVVSYLCKRGRKDDSF